EDGFTYLEKNNLKMVNDGKENIVDDYCALLAATELFKATKKPVYKEAAERRAKSLMSRLISSGKYQNYWRANDKDRPFFHASDAGLPVVSLLYYADVADADTQKAVLDAVRKSLAFELSITNEVANPFGYARELVQERRAIGARASSFLTTQMPHLGGRARMQDWRQWPLQPAWPRNGYRMIRSFRRSCVRMPLRRWIGYWV